MRTQIFIYCCFFLYFLDSRKFRFIHYGISIKTKTTTNDNNIKLVFTVITLECVVLTPMAFYYAVDRRISTLHLIVTCAVRQMLSFQTATCVLRFIRKSLHLSHRLGTYDSNDELCIFVLEKAKDSKVFLQFI